MNDFNTHLFLNVGDILPINYFNPPKDAEKIIAFKPTNKFAENCEKFVFIRSQMGWILSEIIK